MSIARPAGTWIIDKGARKGRRGMSLAYANLAMCKRTLVTLNRQCAAELLVAGKTHSQGQSSRCDDMSVTINWTVFLYFSGVHTAERVRRTRGKFRMEKLLDRLPTKTRHIVALNHFFWREIKPQCKWESLFCQKKVSWYFSKFFISIHTCVYIYVYYICMYICIYVYVNTTLFSIKNEDSHKNLLFERKCLFCLL